MGANKLILVEQHGFQHKRSSVTDLLCFPDEVTATTDRGTRAEVCYPDLQVAFNFVNYGFLDQGVMAFCVDSKVNNWKVRRLKGLYSSSRVEECLSERTAIHRGTQESVSGIHIFLVHVSDIAKGLENPCFEFAGEIRLLETTNSAHIRKELDKVCNSSVK